MSASAHCGVWLCVRASGHDCDSLDASGWQSMGAVEGDGEPASSCSARRSASETSAFHPFLPLAVDNRPSSHCGRWTTLHNCSWRACKCGCRLTARSAGGIPTLRAARAVLFLFSFSPGACGNVYSPRNVRQPYRGLAMERFARLCSRRRRQTVGAAVWRPTKRRAAFPSIPDASS